MIESANSTMGNPNNTAHMFGDMFTNVKRGWFHSLNNFEAVDLVIEADGGIKAITA